MKKLGLLVRLEAKAGKEKNVEEFITSALPLANEEAGTITWYAFRIDSSTFGIFDTFLQEEAGIQDVTKISTSVLIAGEKDFCTSGSDP